MSDAVYTCEHPGCKVNGTAERMWNLKGKPRTIVCDRHAYEARKRGLVTFRLSATFAFLQKLKEERAASDAFFTHFRERAKGVKRADWVRG